MEPAADPSFADFLARVRAGDAAAAEELVRRYEPAIRVIVRANLGAALRSRFDSMDVCQSVMGTFFARAALGQYDLTKPDELLALLARIARNKLTSQARYHGRGCRDVGRAVGGEALATGTANTPTPDREVEGRELLALIRAGMTAEERAIADRRADGQDWATISAELGGTPEGRRKQFARAVNRLAAELGLDEDTDE